MTRPAAHVDPPDPPPPTAGPRVPAPAYPAPRPHVARALNLVAPGCGLIYLGHVVLGALIVTLFAVAAHFALAGALLLPDDVPAAARGLAVGAALGAWIAAQWRLAQILRDRDVDQLALRRRAALAAHHAACARHDSAAAWEALAPVLDLAEVDLSVAVRVAQTLSDRGAPQAAAAWRRVARLDRHRLYAAQIRQSAAERP